VHGGKPERLLTILPKCYEDPKNFKSNSSGSVNVVTHTVQKGISKYIHAAHITAAIAHVLILF